MKELAPIFRFGDLAAARQAGQDALSDDDPWVRSDAQAGVWLRSPRFQDSTRGQYGAIYQSWREWCRLTAVSPLDAKRTDVEAYAVALEKYGNPAAKVSRPLGRRRVAAHLAALSSYYNRALDDEAVTRNPVARNDRPKVSRESPQPHLTREENRALIAAADADGPRSAALVALLLLACLRVSEAVAVQVENLTRQHGHDFVWVRRKGDKSELVVLAPEAATRVYAAIGRRKSGPIIATSTGRPMDRKAAWRTIRRLGQKAGLPMEIGPHTLRHAYITRGHEMGVPVADLQQAAGHESVDTTRGYDRSRRDAARSASFKIAHDLAGPDQENPQEDRRAQ